MMDDAEPIDLAEERDRRDQRTALFAAAEDDAAEQLRMLEALLFAAAEPLDEGTIAAKLPKGAETAALLDELQERYEGRGIGLVCVAGGWRFQTASDLAWLLEDVREEPRKLSLAARETLAIIAYHQPVTRAEIEEIRGVAVSKGTVDLLMEIGWIRMRGRRRTPGRPVTYGATDDFLSHFGLESLADLPGKAELKAAGMLDSRIPKDFEVPDPSVARRLEESLGEDHLGEDGEFHVDFFGEEPDPD